MVKKFKKVTILLILLIAVGIAGYKIGKNQSVVSNIQNNKETSSIEDIFPPLDIPIEYFDASEKSMGDMYGYDVIKDAESFRSYPSTIISIPTSAYSNAISNLPPIKTDGEIHSPYMEEDNFGSTKQDNVKKYGDLARRYIGKGGEGIIFNDVEYADIDKDDKKETILSLMRMGANVGAEWIVVVKDNKEIFSTNSNFFSVLKPAKNGNGFFLEWSEVKPYDGYMTTRFVYDDEKFTPVFEQLTRYIRVKTK